MQGTSPGGALPPEPRGWLSNSGWTPGPVPVSQMALPAQLPLHGATRAWVQDLIQQHFPCSLVRAPATRRSARARPDALIRSVLLPPLCRSAACALRLAHARPQLAQVVVDASERDAPIIYGVCLPMRLRNCLCADSPSHGGARECLTRRDSALHATSDMRSHKYIAPLAAHTRFPPCATVNRLFEFCTGYRALDVLGCNWCV